MKPNAAKENTIHGGVEGDCCLCGCHTHHGTPNYKSTGPGHIVCPGCIPVAIVGPKEAPCPKN